MTSTMVLDQQFVDVLSQDELSSPQELISLFCGVLMTIPDIESVAFYHWNKPTQQLIQCHATPEFIESAEVLRFIDEWSPSSAHQLFNPWTVSLISDSSSMTGFYGSSNGCCIIEGQLSEHLNQILSRWTIALYSKHDVLSLDTQRYYNLCHSIPGIIFQCERSVDTMQFLFISNQIERLFGVLPSSIVTNSQRIDDLFHPSDVAGFHHYIHEIQQEGAYLWEGRMKHPTGWIFVQVTFDIRHCAEKNIWLIDGLITDISESKTVEENQVYIQEIHHRIKNNLQIISSVIDMELLSHSTQSPLSNVLSDIQHRIKSLGFVHDLFCQNSRSFKSDVNEFLTFLVTQIKDTLMNESQQIDMHVKTNGIYLGFDSLISCGLIVNELVTNAFKYAFKNQTMGQICVELTPVSDQSLLLTVSDNGVGLPETFDFNTADSVGLSLIKSIGKKLDASIGFNSDQGTMVSIEFKSADFGVN